MRSCWRLLPCLLAQAFVFAQAPETLSVNLRGPSVYDPVRGRIIEPNADGTTWEWDGSWFRSLADAPPLNHGDAEMVFDPVAQRVLLCTNLGTTLGGLY